MDAIQQIRAFACKWVQQFKDSTISFETLMGDMLGQDCKACGLVPDNKDLLSMKYGYDVYTVEGLVQSLPKMIDLWLLGSAIYSQWQYFHHLVNSGAEIKTTENRAWFLLALRKLSVLAGSPSSAFQGELQKIKLISTSTLYDDNTSVAQSISINKQGRVLFSEYPLDANRYANAKSKNFKINANKIELLFCAFSDVFSSEPLEIIQNSVGAWQLELINTKGDIFIFQGSLHDYTQYMILSNLMRKTLCLIDLWGLDGRQNARQIQKITISHCNQSLLSQTSTHTIDTRHEQWIVDRTTQTIEYVKQQDKNCSISHRYMIAGIVSDLLDSFESKTHFLEVYQPSDDKMENFYNNASYTCTIEYIHPSKQMIYNLFDENGIPDCLAQFLKNIIDCMRFYESNN